MKNIIVFFSCFIVLPLASFSQSISSSPYSLYGVGSLYDSDFGSIPSIGSSGIALPSNNFINNLNPASLGSMPLNHFMLDVGGKAIATTYQNSSRSEKRNNFQFSHLAFAFPITKRSGFSVALRPYSSASYKISNLKLPITDSNESYYLTAGGSGGLNNFDFSYGYRLTEKLSIGASAAFLFGNVVDDRTFLILNSLTNVHKKTDYNGLRATIGTQYKIDSTFTIGATVKLPSQIKSSKIQSVETIADDVYSSIESDIASNVDDYYLPLEIGVGVSKKFKKVVNATLDYHKSLWKDTRQSDLYGEFVNQDRFAFGLTYFNEKRNFRKYWDKVQYSAGANFDTGYLEVDGKRVNDASISIGIKLPIENTFSAVNISYSYGQKGRISNGLIKENYHKLSLNLSLDGIWFVKRKFE